MLQRLKYDEKQPENTRREFDRMMDVNAWRGVGSKVSDRIRRERRKRLPDNAPSWWEGDEEASQSFLRAMRIIVNDGS